MKKIIAVFDGLKFSDSTRDYSISLAKKAQSHLVGVFMEDPHYTSYKIYDLVVDEGVSERRLKRFEENDKEQRHAAVKNFQQSCKDAALEYSVHHDHHHPIDDLFNESVYADLMVVSARESFSHHEEIVPTQFIHHLLAEAQCPLLITPPKFKEIQKIVFLYDGKPNSVQAIKMFSYLLPQLKHIEAEVFTVNSINASSHLPESRLMKEFMKRHFPTAKYTVVEGLAKDEIIHFLKNTNEHTLVVLGAYRRSKVSRMFRESMVDIVLKNAKLPLFVAHNR